MDSNHSDDTPSFESPDPRDPAKFTDPEGEDTWVSDEDIEALNMEQDALGLNETQLAEKILLESLPAVTHSVIKLARSAQSENVRLSAARYVIDRNLGKIGDALPEGEDPVGDLLKGVTSVSK